VRPPILAHIIGADFDTMMAPALAGDKDDADRAADLDDLTGWREAASAFASHKRASRH
jgi:hypothetical protein